MHKLRGRPRISSGCLKSNYKWPTRVCFSSARSATFANSSSQTASAAPEVKSYASILSEMEERSAQWEVSLGKIEKGNLNRLSTAKELYKPIALGDIVLLNLDPVVVICTPEVPNGPYVVADAVGRAKEVFRTMIDARLMSLVDASYLASRGNQLFALDSAATDPPLDSGVEPSVTSSAPTSKVVGPWVHKLIAVPLRRLYNDATRRAKKLLPDVALALVNRQKKGTSTLSFVDLVLEVCPNQTSRFSAVDFYATRLCLDHYTLVNKYLLDFAYTGRYALTVLPQSMEYRNLQVVHGNKRSDAFIGDYACENVPGNEGESRAIELLREKFPRAHRIDTGVAAELLQLPMGGTAQKLRYDWFLRYRTRFLSVPETPDQNETLRAQFSEPVYCIDSADVLEIDDGISIQWLDAGNVRIGIHIANPSAFTEQRSVVKQALSLPTTVYEPNGAAIPMLPRHLTKSFDLVNGKERPALTLFADFELDSKRFSNIIFRPLSLTNIINVTPEKLEKSRDEFKSLYAVARALYAKRQRNGAFEMQAYSICSLASFVVSEFMIMGNHLAAEYCLNRNIPVLYRGQRVLSQSGPLRQRYEEALLAQGGKLSFKWRPLVQKSLVAVEPLHHTGIGYHATTRFTSPLRRLEDYITHCQIEANLHNVEPPFTRNDLARMVPWLQVSQELVKEYQQRLNLHLALTKMKRGEVLDAIVSQVPYDLSAQGVPLTRTKFYLLKYEVEVDYVGVARLSIEEAHQVVIESVSTSAGNAAVLLREESRALSKRTKSTPDQGL